MASAGRYDPAWADDVMAKARATLDAQGAAFSESTADGAVASVRRRVYSPAGGDPPLTGTNHRKTTPSAASIVDLPPAVIRETIRTIGQGGCTGASEGCSDVAQAESPTSDSGSPVCAHGAMDAAQASPQARSELAAANSKLYGEVQRLRRALDLANRRRRTVEADNQQLRRKVKELTVGRRVEAAPTRADAQRDGGSEHGDGTRCGNSCSVLAATCAQQPPEGSRAQGEAERPVGVGIDGGGHGCGDKLSLLPVGWRMVESRSVPGRWYYIHLATGGSQWEHPVSGVATVAEEVDATDTSASRLEAINADGSAMLLPQGAKRVSLFKGDQGFGIVIRADAMVLSYTPTYSYSSDTRTARASEPTASSVPVGWFLAAVAGSATHSRADVLVVLRQQTDVTKLVEFIFVPPPLLLHPAAVHLTPPLDEVLGIAARAAGFKAGPLSRPKLFEHLLVLGAADDTVGRVAATSTGDGGYGWMLGRRRPKELSIASSAPNEAEPEVLCAFPPLVGDEVDENVMQQIRACHCFPDGFRIEAMAEGRSGGGGFSSIGEGLTEGLDAVTQHVFLLHTQAPQSPGSVASGSVSAGEQRPLYGVCLRTREIVAVTEAAAGQGGLGVLSGARSRRICYVAPRCVCLLARAPVFDVLFAILRRFLRDEEEQRLRLQAEQSAGTSSASGGGGAGEIEPVRVRVRVWEGMIPWLPAIERLAELLGDALPRPGEAFVTPQQRVNGQGLARLGLPAHCLHRAEVALGDQRHIGEWALPLVLRAISVRTLMKLLSAVALERHVLVVCSDIGTAAFCVGTLAATVFCTFFLLHPLRYEGTVVPVLAPEMYDLVHSPVAYTLGIPSLESIADTFAEGELQHVHTLIVDDDHFHSPADDVLPSFDCGGLGGGASTRAASNGGVEGNVGARVWQAGEDQLLRQLQPYYSALAAEWQATLDDCDSQAGGSRNGSTVEGLQQLHQQTEGVRRNVRAIMDCFHGHVSSMLDTITLEVRRCHTKMGGLAANHSAAAAAATAAAGGVTHNHEELRFLRELAGTQMFAMHCFKQVPSSRQGASVLPQGSIEDSTTAAASCAAAEAFIEDFVHAAASWAQGLGSEGGVDGGGGGGDATASVAVAGAICPSDDDNDDKVKSAMV